MVSTYKALSHGMTSLGHLHGWFGMSLSSLTYMGEGEGTLRSLKVLSDMVREERVKPEPSKFPV